MQLDAERCDGPIAQMPSMTICACICWIPCQGFRSGSIVWCSKQLRMDGWLEHLLYFAADAAARRDWVQAAKALDTFSACLNHGALLERALTLLLPAKLCRPWPQNDSMRTNMQLYVKLISLCQVILSKRQ